jgi:SAM-dependent methyltransferase
MEEQGNGVRRSAAEHYASGNAIWPACDNWNSIKRASIDAFGNKHRDLLAASGPVLNAGAGSSPYDWMPLDTISVDRFASQIRKMPNGIAADVEQLPFPDEAFGGVVCVGSVLNYVSAIEALAELARVLKPSGVFVLHFETSDSFEHLGSGRWRKDAHPLHTLNNGKPDIVWIYSRTFIRRTLLALGISIWEEQPFHIASAALLRLGVSQQVAAKAARHDGWLRSLSACSDDLVLIGRKL